MNNIARLRRDAGLTQFDLAARVGWNQSRWCHYELGRRTPGLDECRLIVAALNTAGVICELDDVFPPVPSQKAA